MSHLLTVYCHTFFRIFGSMRATVPTFRLIQWKTSHASWMELSKKRPWWFQASRSISCWPLVILLGSIWSRKVVAHPILGQMSSKAHNLSCKCFFLKHQSSVARLSKLLTTFQFCCQLHHFGNTQPRQKRSLNQIFAGEVSRHQLSRTLVAHSF